MIEDQTLITGITEEIDINGTLLLAKKTFKKITQDSRNK